MAKLNKTQVALLEAIFSATNAGSYEFASGKDQKALLDAGLVEANAAITNEAGATATRTTDAGNAYINDLYANGGQAEQEAAKPATASTGFTIAANVEIPTTTRTRTAKSQYPFDDLAVGQSFFVPASEDKPNPVKTMASSVTGANERHSYLIDGEFELNRNGEQVPKKGYHRRFVVRKVEDGAPWGQAGVAGAGIWRTE